MRCKGCGTEIKWIKTSEGRNMPLDAKPIKVYITAIDGPNDTWCLFDAFVPHWATCPDADKFRSKKK